MRRFALLVFLVALLAGVAATVSGGGTQAEARWVIRDLGTLGGQDSWASAISERDEVVGVSEKSLFEGVRRGFLWRQGGMIDLGTLGGQDTEDVAINERGQVIGWSEPARRTAGPPISHALIWQGGKMRSRHPSHTTPAAPRLTSAGRLWGEASTTGGSRGGAPGVQKEVRAFLWEENQMIDLGTLPGGRKAEALAINDLGRVVGWSGNGRSPHAFLWEEGEMTDLGTLPGMSSSIAVAISNHGEIIGQSYGPGRRVHAVVWRDGKIHDLGTLGGKSSKPTAINERGEIVGWSTTAKGQWRAFLWHGRKMVSIDPLAPSWCFARLARGLAINDAGLIAGEADIEVAWTTAFVWENRRLTRLPGEAEFAAINEHGQIVGSSMMKGGPVDHAVLWTLKRG
jgi:probable HAF family extracellular repeat protein